MIVVRACCTFQEEIKCCVEKCEAARKKRAMWQDCLQHLLQLAHLWVTHRDGYQVAAAGDDLAKVGIALALVCKHNVLI